MGIKGYVLCINGSDICFKWGVRESLGGWGDVKFYKRNGYEMFFFVELKV